VRQVGISKNGYALNQRVAAVPVTQADKGARRVFHFAYYVSFARRSGSCPYAQPSYTSRLRMGASRSINTKILNLGIKREMSGQLHTLGMKSMTPLLRVFGGPQSQSGCCGLLK
jgi:hypothetical protein